MQSIRRALSVEGFKREPRRVLSVGLSVLGLAFLLATVVPPNGYDAYAYYMVDANDPYARVGGDLEGKDVGAFRYAPVMGLPPFELLPWGVFRYGWMALQLAALWYVGRQWTLALIIFLPVWHDLVYGNINILLAATIVAGFRYPWVWSFALLTKVTPAVGLVWFAVRREWRNLALAVGVTAAVALASVPLVGLGAWLDWLCVLTSSAGMPTPSGALAIPLIPRLIAAVGVVAWGAATNRRWCVPVGATIAMPTLWPIAFAPLIALLPLLQHARPAGSAATPMQPMP